MKLLVAIKKYLEAPPNGEKVMNQDMLIFTRSMTDEDKVAAKAELRSYGMEIED